MKQLKRNMNGSFTVEAAMIFPFILVCLLVCLYGCLYFHDMVVLEGAAHAAAQRGRLFVTECEQLKEGACDWERFEEKSLLWRLTRQGLSGDVEQYAVSLSEGMLLVCEVPEFLSTAKTDFVSVSYRAKTKLKGIWPAKNQMEVPEISGCAISSGIEGEEFVRLVRALTKKEG